jgi:hypothetical protein
MQNIFIYQYFWRNYLLCFLIHHKNLDQQIFLKLKFFLYKIPFNAIHPVFLRSVK